jgi:hypothetical protein
LRGAMAKWLLVGGVLILSGCRHVGTPLMTKAEPGIEAKPVIAPTVLDTDHDGMPDDWEKAHGLNINSGEDANGDPDGDGLSNLTEYRQGSDPHDYYNGVLPKLTDLQPDGELGPRGALRLLVTDAQGRPLKNAPVTFKEKEGGHKFIAAPGEQPRSEIEVRSGPDGIAIVYVIGGPP